MRSLSALLCLFVCACAEPGVPAPASPSQSPVGVEQEQEPTAEQLLQQAGERLQGKQPTQAQERLQRLFLFYPDHLEARILLAMTLEAEGRAEEAKEGWERVEKILVYHGKQQPFLLQETLYAAAEHFALADNQGRAQLFLEELWRRYPTGDWSRLAQLMVAEAAYGRSRWSEVIHFCDLLLRLKAEPKATSRCQRLTHAATRMLEVGPAADPGAPRWLWEHPAPQGNTLHDVWVSPSGEIVAVGDAGTILGRRPGAKSFSLALSPTRWALRGVAGAADGTIYAVGAAGVILRRVAGSWEIAREASAEQPDLWDVALTAAGRVLAVGEQGIVLTLEQGNWVDQQAATVPLFGVWAPPGQGAALAVGKGGTLLREDGQGGWQSLPSDCYEDLWSIWGRDPEAIYAVGSRRTLISFDGKLAREKVVGRTDFRAVWGDTAGVWAVGVGGDILRLSGSRWLPEHSGTLVDLHGVSGRGGEVWAVGDGGTILTRQNGRWRLVAGGLQQRLVGITAGPAAGEASALGELGLLLERRQGGWRPQQALAQGSYRDLWSDGQQAVAVGNRGLMVVRRESGWERIATGTYEDLQAVWGHEEGIVAVGTRGTLLRVMGQQVVRDPSPTGLDLHSVSGSSARSITVVGNRGVILYFNGERWSEQVSGTLSDLFSVWEQSPQVAFAGGSGGRLLRREGQRWQAMRSPLSQTVVDLWGSSTSLLFAVSSRGAVMQFNGERWQIQHSPADCLTAIDGNPATGVLAVGCHGTVLRWQP